MAFSFDVSANIPRLNQSGTDTSLDGIASIITSMPTIARSTTYATNAMRKPAVPNGMWYRCSTAGTTAATAPTYGTTLGGTTTDGTSVWTAFLAPDVRSLGTGNHYYMPDFRFNITGSLTNENPQQNTITCWDCILSTSNSNFISGKLASDGVTPRWDGTHFIATRIGPNNADPTSFSLQSGAKCDFIGGEIQVAGALGFDNGTTPKFYKTAFRNTKEWGFSSTRIRNWSELTILRDCEFFDIAFDMFRMPSEFSVKGRGCEYVSQYLGALFGGADKKYVASNLENVDGTYDLDNYGSGFVELYNCAKGINLNVVNQYVVNTYLARHCVPLFQDLRIIAKDTAGNPVQNVRFNCTDAPSNSPTTSITTVSNLKTWDFRTPLSYETTSDASGIALSSPVLHVWYWQTDFKKNPRFPLSTAVYQGRAYNYKTLNVSIVLGSNDVQDVSAGMVGLDTPTTVTEAVAGAMTGITMVASGRTGGLVTISSNHSYQDIWDYYRWWISQFSNKGSDDTWNCVGGVLNTGLWGITVNSGVTLTSSPGISTLKTLSTITNNGTIIGGYIDANGNSYLSFEEIDSWKVYSDSARTTQIGSGLALDIFRFNFLQNTKYYLTLMSDGTQFLKEVTPQDAGETVVTLSTQALLIALTNKTLTLPQIEASTVLAKKSQLEVMNEGLQLLSNFEPYDGELP